MPITNSSGIVQETPSTDFDQFQRCGVHRADQFALCHKFDRFRQIQFGLDNVTPGGVITINGGAAGSVALVLPTSSGTLALTGGGAGNSFTTMQPDLGTSPTASSSSDTLTFTSSDSSIKITGTSSTKTLNFQGSQAAITALTGDVTASGTGSVAATVASVGGKTAASIATVVTNTSGTNTGDQTITLTGDVTGSGTGSFATTLKNTGTAGTYPKVTTDAQGRVTSGTTLVSGDIPTGVGFTYPTTNSAYGGNNAAPPALTGLRVTAVGQGAGASVAANSDSSYYGFNSGNAATGAQNTFFGSSTGPLLTTVSNCVIIGYAATSTNLAASSCVIIGASATGGNTNQTIAIGQAATATASNQAVFGSASSPATNIYFGKGVTNATATAYTINGTGGTGSNNAGADLSLAGGAGTGTGNGGAINFKTATAGTTGSSANALVTQFSIAQNGGLNSSASQTTLTGSAGTALCSQPFQGSSYKKAVIFLNGYTDTSTLTYTFPTAFTNTPYIYGLTAGVSGATLTASTIKFAATTLTGFVFVEGY